MSHEHLTRLFTLGEPDMRFLTKAFFASLLVTQGSMAALAQDSATVLSAKGDYLTGAGNFLQGVAWYEVGMAEARAINSDTAIKIARWNRQVYENYKRELEERGAKLQRGTDAIQRRAAEHQFKIRVDPTAKEVLSGEALNALILDLWNPSITDDIWNEAKIPLTLQKPVHDLMFKLVASEAGKANNATIKGVIALSKLDSQNNWPIYLHDEALTSERLAYEKAFQDVKDKCFQNKLELPTVIRMDQAIDRLKAKVNQVIPVERDFRKQATSYVESMKASTAMFNADMIDFAQEMIRDTKDHEAKTVAQLIAFMRKYQLIFADASGNPKVGELYRALLPSLQTQKQALGLKNDAPNVADNRSIVGQWSHHNVANDYRMEITFHSNGTFTSTPDPENRVGTWTQKGSIVNCRINDKNAPGGVSLSSVTISSDGLTYRGKKYNGQTIIGSRNPN